MLGATNYLHHPDPENFNSQTGSKNISNNIEPSPRASAHLYYHGHTPTIHYVTTSLRPPSTSSALPMPPSPYFITTVCTSQHSNYPPCTTARSPRALHIRPIAKGCTQEKTGRDIEASTGNPFGGVGDTAEIFWFAEALLERCHSLLYRF